MQNKFIARDRGAPKSLGPVAIATFANIVNPALHRLTKNGLEKQFSPET